MPKITAKGVPDSILENLIFRESWSTNPNLQLSMEKSCEIEGSTDVGEDHCAISKSGESR